MGDYWKFFACLGVMCFVYPPFLGFVSGLAVCIAIMYIIYWILQNIM